MPEKPTHLLGRAIRKYRQIGLLPTLRMIWSGICGTVPWIIFRLKNADAPNVPEQADVASKEDRVCGFLEKMSGRSFLEIGIGATPSLKRFQKLVGQAIDYTGCDFERVCEYHKAVLDHEGLLKSNIHFVGNRTGTYARTLFDMAQQRRQFTMIYLDGAHTFYIDLPAFYLANTLLEPGGYFLVDDINWTLSFMRAHMRRSFEEWLFYHRIYNFDEYTTEQQDEKAIKLIAEEVLIKQYGYELLREGSLEGWWALQKPRA